MQHLLVHGQGRYKLAKTLDTCCDPLLGSRNVTGLERLTALKMPQPIHNDIVKTKTS